MQCSICQYELPSGVTFCPNCGTPVRTGSSPNQGIPPTVAATPPGQGIPPTVAAAPLTPPPPPSSPYGVSTSYGENPPPPPQSYDPTPPPYGAYNAPQQAPYGASSPQAPYGAPPPTPYGAPPPQYVQPQQPKKSNGCVIAVVIVLVVFVLIIGSVVALVAYGINKGSQAVATASTNFQSTITSANQTATVAESTITSQLTPATGTGSGVPDPSQIDPTAHANITGAQTSAGMDSNYKPTHPTTNFATGSEVDITFTLAGNAGYATAKIYADGQLVAQPDTPLTINSGDTTGYFSYTPDTPGQYVAGLYWCTQSDCSDAALAQIVDFTVS
ncbi:MAG TPA: zinc ribbon domain-containing protein [Ktedonobacteraceae bacterium]|jgi:hypothetical protein|nr:zinc ribbon domain-containing protein [Ktedonobacteraceae bacterium]